MNDPILGNVFQSDLRILRVTLCLAWGPKMVPLTLQQVSQVSLVHILSPPPPSPSPSLLSLSQLAGLKARILCTGSSRRRSLGKLTRACHYWLLGLLCPGQFGTLTPSHEPSYSSSWVSGFAFLTLPHLFNSSLCPHWSLCEQPSVFTMSQFRWLSTGNKLLPQ